MKKHKKKRKIAESRRESLRVAGSSRESPGVFRFVSKTFAHMTKKLRTPAASNETWPELGQMRRKLGEICPNLWGSARDVATLGRVMAKLRWIWAKRLVGFGKMFPEKAKFWEIWASLCEILPGGARDRDTGV